MIGDVEIAVRIDDDVRWPVQRCPRGPTAVAAESRAAVSGDRGDRSVRADLADQIGVLLGGVEIPGAVESQAGHAEESDIGRCVTVVRSAAGHGDDGLPMRSEGSGE